MTQVKTTVRRFPSVVLAVCIPGPAYFLSSADRVSIVFLSVFFWFGIILLLCCFGCHFSCTVMGVRAAGSWDRKLLCSQYVV